MIIACAFFTFHSNNPPFLFILLESLLSHQNLAVEKVRRNKSAQYSLGEGANSISHPVSNKLIL